MYRGIRKIYLIGIGGTGMCGIAEILLSRGYEVAGSDIAATDVTRRLAELGARIVKGHGSREVLDADVVVVSTAINDENPEVGLALSNRIPVIPRAQMLAELMRMKYGIAVAGTHGKTTTTSIIAHVFIEGGLDPTIIVGGRLAALGSHAKPGRGSFLIAEACESDGSFLRLTPAIAVITSIDREHLDFYPGLDEIRAAFVKFANQVPFFGAVVFCLDDPNIQSVIPSIDRRLISYGITVQADVMARNIEREGLSSSFDLYFRGDRMGRVAINMPGIHMIYNSLAAAAVGLEAEIPFGTIRDSLAGFPGVGRRMEKKGEVKGILFLDDYGHHPTEVEVTLRTIKEGWDRRLITIFQPHRFSRTRSFADEFGKAFYHADRVIVTDVYPAGEEPIAGVSGELVAEAARRHGHRSVEYIPDREDIPGRVTRSLREGDIVLTLGAGNIWRTGESIMELLRGK